MADEPAPEATDAPAEETSQVIEPEISTDEASNEAEPVVVSERN